MANAWFLKPLPIVGALAAGSSLGEPMYVANDYAGVVWRSADTGGVDLVIDLGADVVVDGLLLFGCSGLGAGAVLQVAAARAATGPSGAYDWVDAAVPALAGAVPPTSGRTVVIWEAPAAPPPAARYYRLRFGGLGASPVTIARVVIGKRILLERNFGYGAAFGVRDLGSLDFSARGVMLRRRGAKLRTVGLTFSSVRKDEVEATVQPLLEQLGNTEMVGLVVDPAADAQRQNRCYFGPLVGDLGTTRRNAVAYEAKANLVSIF